MFPYFEQRALRLGPLRLYPFGILMFAAVVAGVVLLRARAAKRGLDSEVATWFCVALVVCGLAGAYLLRLVFFGAGGIYSFGGLFAGVAGGWLYLRKAPRRWEYFDALGFVFPMAWLLGRAGCAVAHDHPGIRSASWLAMRYPGGARYDLGLLEALYMLPVLALFLWLDRKPRPAGFYLGLFLLVYGPFRVWLDTLHESAPLFVLTPDQFWGVAAFAAGALVLRGAAKRGRGSLY